MNEKKHPRNQRYLSVRLTAAIICVILAAGCLCGLIACSTNSTNSNSGSNSASTSTPATNTTETTNAAKNTGTYSIQYNLSNGTIKNAGANPKLNVITSNCGESLTLYTLDQTGWGSAASQAGYTFLGWSYTSGAANTKVDYSAGSVLPDGLAKEDGSVAANGDTINLYGVWKQA